MDKCIGAQHSKDHLVYSTPKVGVTIKMKDLIHMRLRVNKSINDSTDELKAMKLRPPEHKKSFIDMISRKSGLNISYVSNSDDPEDQKSDYSEEIEENEILEEVFKKNSISSLDSVRSGASLKYKPIVCPLNSCYKFVSDIFECCKSIKSKDSLRMVQLKQPGSMRPHTFGGEKKRNIHISERDLCEKDDSTDELKAMKLRPPEHKKSFIDMISRKSGLNISYVSNSDDPEDQKSDYSEEIEENEILEEVFKKNSISSLDSVRSGASLKYKPIVCPLNSCYKFVSVSGLITHFKFDHPQIPIQMTACNDPVSFFVQSSVIESKNIVNEKIFVIDADSHEDSGYFALNITKQCFAETDMLLIWVSEIKLNSIQYLYKIQAKNNDNDRGKVVSYFGPVTNHQDPLAVFQNGDCLVIPMTVFDSFKDYADGFDVTITFTVGPECAPVDANELK
ncbi:uncharacterized protein LOC103524794 [Diaphorina citri]|uniref:Uncharacterized protein LOC103524794 n=1 Tax=Diaphorina citri TaxID=121845 RepID=A0A3Q0II35_DIACI|nr:uncharacterized protein LOC103524794 [Diaphorina citri]